VPGSGGSTERMKPSFNVAKLLKKKKELEWKRKNYNHKYSAPVIKNVIDSACVYRGKFRERLFNQKYTSVTSSQLVSEGYKPILVLKNEFSTNSIDPPRLSTPLESYILI
jgi:hypothetical protein